MINLETADGWGDGGGFYSIGKGDGFGGGDSGIKGDGSGYGHCNGDGGLGSGDGWGSYDGSGRQTYPVQQPAGYDIIST